MANGTVRKINGSAGSGGLRNGHSTGATARIRALAPGEECFIASSQTSVSAYALRALGPNRYRTRAVPGGTIVLHLPEPKPIPGVKMDQNLTADFRLRRYAFTVFDTAGEVIVSDEIQARNLGSAWTQAVAHAMAHYDHTLKVPNKITVEPVLK